VSKKLLLAILWSPSISKSSVWCSLIFKSKYRIRLHIFWNNYQYWPDVTKNFGSDVLKYWFFGDGSFGDGIKIWFIIVLILSYLLVLWSNCFSTNNYSWWRNLTLSSDKICSSIVDISSPNASDSYKNPTTTYFDMSVFRYIYKSDSLSLIYTSK